MENEITLYRAERLESISTLSDQAASELSQLLENFEKSQQRQRC